MPAFQFLLSCVPAPFPLTGYRRGTRLSTQNAYIPVASGLAGRVIREWVLPHTSGHRTRHLMRFCVVTIYKTSSHRSPGTERMINLLTAGQRSRPLETGPAVGRRDNDHGPATLVGPPPQNQAPSQLFPVRTTESYPPGGRVTEAEAWIAFCQSDGSVLNRRGAFTCQNAAESPDTGRSEPGVFPVT